MERKVVGIIRGNYDGSRAMIHQLSVHPAYQKRGIGSNLVKAIVERFQQLGAPTVSAVVVIKLNLILLEVVADEAVKSG